MKLLPFAASLLLACTAAQFASAQEVHIQTSLARNYGTITIDTTSNMVIDFQTQKAAGAGTTNHLKQFRIIRSR